MAKLFVIPARDEPCAVILRRGPSSWYHVIRWDLQTDEFVHGAWIKGRIYEQMCDVSPDGKLFLYSVIQGSRHNTEFTHCWTAISRVPWLHALAVWPMGTTYGGGGRFTSNLAVTLRLMGRDPVDHAHPDYPIHGIVATNGSPPIHESTTIVPDADWCGTDQAGDMIFARGDCLFRMKRNEATLVADFCDLRPDPQPAPAWATRSL